jgi:hypothetical protein
VDELHLGYRLLAYDPAEDLERVSLDRARPRAIEASSGDQTIARTQGDLRYLHRHAAIPPLLVVALHVSLLQLQGITRCSWVEGFLA